MTMQEQSTPTKCQTSTCSVPDFLAKASLLRESGLDSKTREELCSLKLPDSLQPNGLHFFFWKTYRGCYRMTGARRLKPSTPRLLKWGIILNGVCITADISESPSSDGACILSDILIPDVPDKYDLREGESIAFATVEPSVAVNHAGTIITKEPIIFGEEGYIEFDDDSSPNFLGDHMSVEEFQNTDVSQNEDESLTMGGMRL